MSQIISVLRRGIRKEVDNIVEFVRTPKGIFQTIDEIIIDARTTVRELVHTVKPAGLKYKLRGMRIRRLRR